MKILHISDTHKYHDLLTIPGLDTIFSNGSVVTDGKFGKLSSHGNIFEII
jgi:hypothetical protein